MKRRHWSQEEKMAIVLNRSISEVCREHQISQALYYQWRDAFLEGAKAGLRPKRQTETAMWEKKIAEYERLVGTPSLKEGLSSIQVLVEANEVTVTAVCKALEIEHSTYYREVKRSYEVKARSCPRQKILAQEVKRLTTQYPTFGYRRIWALLQRKGYPCNQKTVYRAMKRMNLLQKTIQYGAKRSVGERPAHPTGPNQRLITRGVGLLGGDD